MTNQKTNNHENDTERLEETKTTIKKRKSTAKDVAYVALGTAIICVLAPLSIPVLPVPFSFATLAVFFVSAMLGWKKGVVAVVAYILLGVVGLPVFSNFNSGFGVITGATGGYIVGYIPCAFLTGLFADLFRDKKLFPVAMVGGMILGLFACYFLGTAWFVVFCQGSKTVAEALALCVTPFLLFDGAKMLLAATLTCFLNKVLKIR